MPAASLALHAVVAPSITAVRYIAFLRRDFNLGSGRTLHFAEESFYNFYCCVALLVFGSSPPPLPPSPFLKRWSALYAVDTGSSPEALRLPGWNRCHVHFGVAIWPLPLKRMHKVLNYIIGLVDLFLHHFTFSYLPSKLSWRKRSPCTNISAQRPRHALSRDVVIYWVLHQDLVQLLGKNEPKEGRSSTTYLLEKTQPKLFCDI